MQKIMILGMVALFSISCSQNKELVSYTVDGKTKKVMTQTAMKEMRVLYEYLSPQNMDTILSTPDIFKSVLQNRLFEAELLTVEAQKISNYQDDPAYQKNLDDQKTIIAYNIAYQKSLDSISNEVSKQKMEVAVVSRIMLTNQEEMQLQEVLEELLASENPVIDFALAAEKYSHDLLGAQNGGYLGHIKKGQFTVLDDIVFKQKYEGIFPEIVQDENGFYLIFVHTPAKAVKVANIEKEGIMLNKDMLQVDYVVANIVYEFVATNLPMIVLNGVEKNINDLTDKDVLLRMWKKKYTVKELREVLQLLLGRSTELSTEELFTLLLPSMSQPISPAVYQVALILKNYNKNIINTKEYKEQLAENQKALELEIVYAVVSQELYQGISTNVTSEELMTFYNDTNNRVVKSYSDNGQAIYETFKDSQEELTQKIITQRLEIVQRQFLDFLTEEYKIVWNEESVNELRISTQEDFSKYLAEQNLDQGLDQGFEEVLEF
ncbi:MAG: peptidylprolyl isomerase [Brevinema sp.]